MYSEKLAPIMLLSHESLIKAKKSQNFKEHVKVFRKIIFQMFGKRP